MKIICPHCRKTKDKPAGAVNRARAIGAPIYCGRRCAGLGRRKHKTKAQKVEEKRLYDEAYRVKNREMLKAKKAQRHKLTYDPVKAAKVRKKRMPYHVQYCRRPEYVRWKREYDRQYRAKEFGPFAEAYLLTVDLNREVKNRSSNYEIRQQNGTGNKTQKRRREAGQASREPHRASEGQQLA